jgi:myo-inositol 2-dehydrogenase/D-chiro-inositol 1-dehydrogenase
VTLFMSRFAAYGYDQRCEIFGTEGSVSVQNVPEHTTTIATAAGMRQARLQHSFPERFHHAFGLELDAFADTVLHDKAWPVSPDQCIHVQKVADAARLSCEIGTIVSLQDNSFV